MSSVVAVVTAGRWRAPGRRSPRRAPAGSRTTRRGSCGRRWRAPVPSSSSRYTPAIAPPTAAPASRASVSRTSWSSSETLSACAARASAWSRSAWARRRCSDSSRARPSAAWLASVSAISISSGVHGTARAGEHRRQRGRRPPTRAGRAAPRRRRPAGAVASGARRAATSSALERQRAPSRERARRSARRPLHADSAASERRRRGACATCARDVDAVVVRGWLPSAEGSRRSLSARRRPDLDAQRAAQQAPAFCSQKSSNCSGVRRRRGRRVVRRRSSGAAVASGAVVPPLVVGGRARSSRRGRRVPASARPASAPVSGVRVARRPRRSSVGGRGVESAPPPPPPSSSSLGHGQRRRRAGHLVGARPRRRRSRRRRARATASRRAEGCARRAAHAESGVSGAARPCGGRSAGSR